jgi:hypothetical protein
MHQIDLKQINEPTHPVPMKSTLLDRIQCRMQTFKHLIIMNHSNQHHIMNIALLEIAEAHNLRTEEIKLLFSAKTKTWYITSADKSKVYFKKQF